jgi:hypothetical protein
VAARFPRIATVGLEFLIEKDALLIRKIITAMEARKYPVTEMHDSIRIDEPIDDAVFMYAA